MTIEELYQHKLAGNDQWLDMVPRMPDLRRYAEKVDTVVEFGCRTGNSTSAFLAGGARVYSYDIAEPDFVCPAEQKRNSWSFTKADTRNMRDIPRCDLLFIDTIHTAAQVRAELRMAIYVGRYILLHDVKEWGWLGENREPGILYSVFRFLAASREWGVAELLGSDQWGVLVLERISP